MRSPDHRLRVTARPEDIDELGHVSNIVYVRWVQDAAVSHSTAAGWSPSAYLAENVAFVARRHEIDYLAPAASGDELELITWVESWTFVTCVRKTRMVRVSDGKELVQASTTWAFVSTATGRPTRIPPQVSGAFGAAEG